MLNRSHSVLVFFDSCATNNLSVVVYQVAIWCASCREKSRFDVELQRVVNYGYNFAPVAVYCTHFTILGHNGTPLFKIACPRVYKRGDMSPVAIYKTIVMTLVMAGNTSLFVRLSVAIHCHLRCRQGRQFGVEFGMKTLLYEVEQWRDVVV